MRARAVKTKTTLVNRAWRRCKRISPALLLLLLTAMPFFGTKLEQQPVTVPVLEPTVPQRDAVFGRIALAAEKNKDVVGWLTVGGCEIDDPVVQGRDNEEYLRRGVESAVYDVWGCYFMDWINRQDGETLQDRVTILYGHALGDDPDSERFSKLKRYKDADFARRHPTLTFSLSEKRQEYRIFAAAELPVSIDYIDPNPEDGKYKNTLEQLLQNSAVDFGVPVDTEDRILLLSTCTGDKSTRFVLAAKPICEAEV